MERIILHKDQVLFTEGDAPTVAYLIESGEIEITTSRAGERLVLSTLIR